MYTPRRYFSGLSKTQKKQKLKEMQHFGSFSWKDPKAYKPFKTDVGAPHRTSSYSSLFQKKYPGSTSLPEIAKATGVSLSVLTKVYNRGMAAWRTGHRPGATEHGWAMARVHSFVLHGKTWHTADSDLA